MPLMTHKINYYATIFFATSSILFSACNQQSSSYNGGILIDSAAVAVGKNIFDQNCIACHTMEHDGIGPALGGITEDVSAGWIKDFIKNPGAVIESGDERGKALFAKYNTIMPSFSYYKEEEIDGIIAYLHTQGAKKKKIVVAGNAKALEDPIPYGIAMSDLVVNLELLTQMPATSEQKPLTRITKYYSRPDTKEFYVLDLRGKLYRLTNDKPEVYMDLAALVSKFINAPGHATGFGSFAFHPGFAKNGLLYTTHTEEAGSAEADFYYEDSLNVKLQWVISEWTTAQPAAFPFSGKRRELFRVNMFGQSHGVQEITFNPQARQGEEDYGLLYIGIGDGGSAENGVLHINKGPENIWSSIIRIDPAGRNSANGNYGIPESNPFVNSDNPKALGEVYAFGFRNPHRISWTKTGMMLASNIGQHGIEELNLILPGHDYGWPTREGRFVIHLKESTRFLYPLAAGDDERNLDYPVLEYDHDEGAAIIGGYEYQGETIPVLKGKYLFGDMVNGRLFYVNVDGLAPGQTTPMKEFRIALNGKITSFKELCDDDRLSMRFGQDHLGEIYVSTMPDGKIYKMVK
jgi:glucose/arabinose dehydrogenase/mono/diheme cytochrome c family protein